MSGLHFYPAMLLFSTFGPKLLSGQGERLGTATAGVFPTKRPLEADLFLLGLLVPSTMSGGILQSLKNQIPRGPEHAALEGLGCSWAFRIFFRISCLLLSCGWVPFALPPPFLLPADSALSLCLYTFLY